MVLANVEFPVLPIVKVHLIINCVIVLFMLVIVALRLTSRIISGAWLGWDDWLILLSVPQGIGMLVIQGLYLPLGVGYHLFEVLPNIKMVLLLSMVYSIVYAFCIGFIKLSVLCFYLRVFAVGTTRFRMVTYVTIGLVAAWTAANTLMLFLICRPFEANYGLAISGECGNRLDAYFAIGAFNLISDVVIMLLPIPVIWGLKAQKKWKAGLISLLSLGLIVSAVAVGRLIALTELELTNATGTMVWVDFLSTTEINLGIICVSIPMLGPAYRRLTGRGKEASKLSGTPPDSYGKGYGRSTSRSAQAPNMTLDDGIVLDTIYANNLDESHNVTVTTHKDHCETVSQDGSEVSFTRSTEHPKEMLREYDDHLPRPMRVRVQSQWEVWHA